MTTCFVEFGGRGFWAPDALVEACLLLLVRQVDTLPVVPDWLEEARDYWELQSSLGCGALLCADFDAFLTSPTRSALLLMLADSAFRNPFLSRSSDLWIEDWPSARCHGSTLVQALDALFPADRSALELTATRLVALLAGQPIEEAVEAALVKM